MFSVKYRQHWGFDGWQLLTELFVPLFPKPQTPDNHLYPQVWDDWVDVGLGS